MKAALLSLLCLPLLLGGADLVSIWLEASEAGVVGTVDFQSGRFGISFGDVVISSVPTLAFPSAFGVLVRVGGISFLKGFSEADVTGLSLSFMDLTIAGYYLRQVGDEKLDEKGLGVQLFGDAVTVPENVFEEVEEEEIKVNASLAVVERKQVIDREKAEEMFTTWTIAYSNGNFFLSASQESFSASWREKDRWMIRWDGRKLKGELALADWLGVSAGVSYSFGSKIVLQASGGATIRLFKDVYPVTISLYIDRDNWSVSAACQHTRVEANKREVRFSASAFGASLRGKLSANILSVDTISYSQEVPMEGSSLLVTASYSRKSGFRLETGLTVEF